MISHKSFTCGARNTCWSWLSFLHPKKVSRRIVTTMSSQGGEQDDFPMAHLHKFASSGHPLLAVRKSREEYLHKTLEEKAKESRWKSSSVTSLEDVPTWPQYADQKKLETQPAKKSKGQSLGSKLSIWQGDITKLSVDAIVNAANKSLMGGGGVDGAIHRMAGNRLLQECKMMYGCNTGDAKISGGYLLPAKYVIHTVGPIVHSYGRGIPMETEQLLGRCYHSCLQKAQIHNDKHKQRPEKRDVSSAKTVELEKERRRDVEDGKKETRRVEESAEGTVIEGRPSKEDAEGGADGDVADGSGVKRHEQKDDGPGDVEGGSRTSSKEAETITDMKEESIKEGDKDGGKVLREESRSDVGAESTVTAEPKSEKPLKKDEVPITRPEPLIRSIAFPCISTGIYGYPQEDAAHVALETVKNWFETNEKSDIERVIFCLFLDSDVEIYEDVLPIYFPLNGEKSEAGKSKEPGKPAEPPT